MTYRDPRYYREMPCPACGEMRANSEFRGRSIKTAACKQCEATNPGHRWCLDCEEWVVESDFYWDKTSQKFRGNRCKPCSVHRSHGVTRKFMVDLTGRPTPACSACGDTDRLSIDHDHAHCVSEAGCQHCVRGYLCRACNVAEGLLKTVERAESLVAYMKSSRLTSADLASLPPSLNEKRPARPSRKSAAQPHVFYEYPIPSGEQVAAQDCGSV